MALHCDVTVKTLLHGFGRAAAGIRQRAVGEAAKFSCLMATLLIRTLRLQQLCVTGPHMHLQRLCSQTAPFRRSFCQWT